jgi:hypothetical protein
MMDSMKAVDADSGSRGAEAMIEYLRNELMPILPLAIGLVAVENPTLTLAGDGWAFSSPSAWRVIKDGVLEFGWSHEVAPDLLQDLCGLSIVSVASQSPVMSGDPTFRLSDDLSGQPRRSWARRPPPA